MDMNTAFVSTVEATKAAFAAAAPTTVEAITKVTNTVGAGVISVGTGTVDVLKEGAKFAINLFFPGTIA